MLAATLVLAHAPRVGSSDSLLQKPTMTCRDWAIVADEYLALGEARAVARLKAVETGRRDPFSNASTRRGLLCRILFVTRRGGVLREPAFGGLDLPYRSMPASRWPEYPFVEQNGVWFLLGEGYFGTGKGEPTPEYVDYCRRAGSFRTVPLPVPTSEQAASAVGALLSSPRWRVVRWSFKGVGETYSISPETVVERLREQARF